MSKKLHFRSVVALVIGSQIGSGIFLLPTSLAPFGAISLFGWLTSGCGAILLALVFGQLSMRISKGGGPHVYIEQAFGRRAAFFTAWTYWLISWASSIAVIVAAIGYLSSLVNISGPILTLALEIAIVTGITAINIRSASLAGSCEVFLTFLKCAPLILIPIAGFFFIKTEHFTFPQGPSFFSSLNTSSLLTFWGFIGLETATTAAGIIEKPTQTIPRAIIVGTLIVAAIYFLNSFAVMGVLPSSVLMNSQAPYVDAAKVMFGGSWHCMIALAAFISCIGTLNAWVLTSGQIAAEASKEGLFPSFFAKSNKSGSPYISLLIALVCTQILLFLTLTPNILQQLNTIIDLSVSIFLFIYLACGFAFLKMLFQKQITSERPKLYAMIALLACLFCIWVLAFTSWKNLLLCSLFVISGLPIYLWQRKKLSKSTRVA
jgi:basic amino acid/polyamine antiporter, APA family